MEFAGFTVVRPAKHRVATVFFADIHSKKPNMEAEKRRLLPGFCGDSTVF
jgi:hypothetical protein